ncbi:hypothetical protein D3C73_780030 [compost metagenome]
MTGRKLGEAPATDPASPMVNVHPQGRCKALQFPLPVPQQRGWAENQHRLTLFFRRCGQRAIQQAGNYLHSLSQTHVIGQTDAEAQTAQRGQPLKPSFLIRSQRAVQTRRHSTHRQMPQHVALHKRSQQTGGLHPGDRHSFPQAFIAILGLQTHPFGCRHFPALVTLHVP